MRENGEPTPRMKMWKRALSIRLCMRQEESLTLASRSDSNGPFFFQKERAFQRNHHTNNTSQGSAQENTPLADNDDGAEPACIAWEHWNDWEQWADWDRFTDWTKRT